MFISFCNFHWVEMFYVGVLIQDIGKTGKNTYFNSGFATQFLLNTKGNVDKASRKFLNLLAVPDTVVSDKDKGLADANIILGASSFGIVCWPATPVDRESRSSQNIMLAFPKPFSLSKMTVSGNAKRFKKSLEAFSTLPFSTIESTAPAALQSICEDKFD